jgi:hypothetical protein
MRGANPEFILNEYSRSYLEQQQLAACHWSKLKFGHERICEGDQEWSQYLEVLGITSQKAIKLLTEAAVLGSAIEHGLSPDNPFAQDNNPQTLGEILAYGLRNPHRFSWDTMGERKMLIADIGQAFIEEINLGIQGPNYGWGEREGTWVITEENENVLYPLPANDAKFNYTYPVAQYDHDEPTNIQGKYPVVIAGSYVYLGQTIPN